MTLRHMVDGVTFLAREPRNYRNVRWFAVRLLIAIAIVAVIGLAIEYIQVKQEAQRIEYARVSLIREYMP